jgi:hypothetical protein
MMLARKPVLVRADFRSDAHAAVAALLIQRGFQVPADADVHDVLYMHFNVERRRIAPLPRPAFWSADLRAHESTLAGQYREALAEIEEASQRGEDLNARLSRKLVGRRKRATFADHLFCEWGINHLHLGDRLDSHGVIEGTKDVVFVIARKDGLYFIDVLDHCAFAEQRLFDTAVTNWPHLFDRQRAPTIAPSRDPSQRLSAEERAAARQGGVNALTIGPDGCVYLPSGGIATDRSSSAAMREADAVVQAIDNEQRLCVERGAEILEKINAATGRTLAALELRLVHAGGGVLKAQEIHTGIFAVPKA